LLFFRGSLLFFLGSLLFFIGSRPLFPQARRFPFRRPHSLVSRQDFGFWDLHVQLTSFLDSRKEIIHK
jgi:hypothetical protein